MRTKTFRPCDQHSLGMLFVAVHNLGKLFGGGRAGRVSRAAPRQRGGRPDGPPGDLQDDTTPRCSDPVRAPREPHEPIAPSARRPWPSTAHPLRLPTRAPSRRGMARETLSDRPPREPQPR
jgi:hypothetical protein